MNLSRSLSKAAILVVALLACNCGGNNTGKPDGGGGNPVGRDGGNPLGRDAGEDDGIYKVECTGPSEPVPVNTQVTISCIIDSMGASLAAPLLSVSPADGVEMANGTQPGVVYFALSTGKTGYSHPKTFQDTTYTLTVEVHNAANEAEFGKGRAKITVLGNYWIGDSSTNGQGIHIFRSDGKYLAQAVGPAGITGVTSLMMMPSGDIAVSSFSSRVIKIFDRKGVQRPVTFADRDRFAGDITLWEGEASFTNAGPGQMAYSSTGELWVAGALEKKVQNQWGIAVFNPSSGELIKFVPHPEVATDHFRLSSLARRTDGKIVASSDQRRRVCIFDEMTYASEGCFTAGDTWSGTFKTLMAMEQGQVLVGVKESTDAGLLLLGPTLTTDLVGEEVSYPDITGLVRSGGEILALGNFGYSCCDPQLARFSASDLKLIDIWHLDTASGTDFYNTAGIVRLTVPGN
ncbi:MAG: hypothetical protein QM765_19840 [Myxococcales bacterium]